MGSCCIIQGAQSGTLVITLSGIQGGEGRKGYIYIYNYDYRPPVAQTVKNPPAMQETRVRFLGWEVPLEKGMAVHTSILAWRIPWTEKPGRL